MTWQNIPVDPLSPAASQDAQPRKSTRPRLYLILGTVGFLFLCLIGLIGIGVVGQQILEKLSPTLTAMAQEPSPVTPEVSSTPAATEKVTKTATTIPQVTPQPKDFLVWSKTAAQVNVYEAADATSSVLTVLGNGTLVRVKEKRSLQGHSWLRVEISGGMAGWIEGAAAYLPLEGQAMYVAQGANLRESPNGSIQRVLFAGSPVYLTGKTSIDAQNQVWVQVGLLDGRQGWMVQWLLGEKP